MDEEDVITFFDASLIVTFTAPDIDEADAELDRIIDILDEQGYDVQIGSLEESIKIDE